jgi:hypothetical protein
MRRHSYGKWSRFHQPIVPNSFLGTEFFLATQFASDQIQGEFLALFYEPSEPIRFGIGKGAVAVVVQKHLFPDFGWKGP